MIIGMAWSGGKDSMLALDRLVRDGHDVRFLFNLFDGRTRRIRFHGVRRELIQRQAERLGLIPVQLPVREQDFESVFLRGLSILRAKGVSGVAFGNIHLADVRAWYEERTTANGFKHIEPLWGGRPTELVSEMLSRGYRALLTSVSLDRSRQEWLGRTLDDDLLREIQATPGVDPAGESGDYHSFVYEGPLFRSPIGIATGEQYEAEGHALIDIIEATE
jgi:uncharacterized protein (TIGR00290 family)